MYKIIQAQSTHVNQIIPYLSITCYWKEFVEGNSLNQSYEDFMSEWVVTPRLPFTKVIVQANDEQKIFGCIITATTDELSTMPDYTPHLHPKVMEVFGSWFQFAVSDSVVIELIAVDEHLRGQGYGSKLYQIAENLAQDKNKDCISGFIWACFPISLINAIKKGRMVTHCINFQDPIKIPLLYLQKRPDYIKTVDYFQSTEYKNIHNMLLDS